MQPRTPRTEDAPTGSADPEDEPLTEAQRAELDARCRKTGEHVERDLTRGQARCRIETLKSLDTLPRC